LSFVICLFPADARFGPSTFLAPAVVLDLCSSFAASFPRDGFEVRDPHKQTRQLFMVLAEDW